MVGRRGEAPLVPPYILCNFKLHGAVQCSQPETNGYPSDRPNSKMAVVSRRWLLDSNRLWMQA